MKGNSKFILRTGPVKKCKHTS